VCLKLQPREGEEITHIQKKPGALHSDNRKDAIRASGNKQDPTHHGLKV
jgi:hypothetical protein